MADETKAPQIENPEKITAKDLAEMVKQMRHNQRRCQRNPTPEKLATLESWERKVDAVVAVLTDTQMKLFWYGRMDYIYLGDRLTRPELRRMPCRAVRRADGKCIRGRNGNMLVEFDGVGKCVILGRLLRKIKNSRNKK